MWGYDSLYLLDFINLSIPIIHTHTQIHAYIGAHDVNDIVIGNGHCNLCPNPVQGCLYFT